MPSRKPIACLSTGYGEMPAGDVLAVPQFVVAALPALTGSDRAIAFATNGRAVTGSSLGAITVEAAGAGTGCLVTWNGSAWKIAGTTATVAA